MQKITSVCENHEHECKTKRRDFRDGLDLKSVMADYIVAASKFRKKIKYFRTSFSPRSDLSLDINFVAFVWLRLFYCTRDLHLSTCGAPFAPGHLALLIGGLPGCVLSYRCYAGSTTIYNTSHASCCCLQFSFFHPLGFGVFRIYKLCHFTVTTSNLLTARI